MRYALLLHNEEPEPGAIPDEELAAMQAAFQAYARDLDAAGVLVGGDILAGSETATTVAVRGDDVAVHDGPFAESKELLAGVFVVDVDDLDAALGWARRCPGATYGTVEVRPVAISIVDGVWQR